jgi:transposase
MALGRVGSPAAGRNCRCPGLREYDRLIEDLKIVGREFARAARTDANLTRLMTIREVDMVVAVGLVAAIGPVTPFSSSDRVVAYLGLNPSVYQSESGKPRCSRTISMVKAQQSR